MKHQITSGVLSTSNLIFKHNATRRLSTCTSLVITSSTYAHKYHQNILSVSPNLLPSLTGCNLTPKRWGSQVPTASSSLGPNFTKAQAVLLIEKLTSEERKLFLKELKKVVVTKEGDVTSKPTFRELKQLAYHNSLPFIGFGFLDNFIMIMAGEYIDITLGAKLGISTMAAAAFGNTISDMMGIGSAWYVESWADRLGAHPPDLTPEQLEMPVSRICANLGRCLGVMFGCLLGMFPLLFIDTSEKEEERDEAPKTSS